MKTIILSCGRTGTQMLYHTIAKNYPEYKMLSEPLHFTFKSHPEYEDIPPIQLLDKLLGKYDSIKLLYYQFLEDESLVDWLSKQDVQFLHLKRKNILATKVSQKIASLTNKWKSEHSEKTNYDLPPIEITFNELFNFYKFLQKSEAKINSRLSNVKSFYYESLVSYWQSSWKHIEDYIGLEHKDVFPGIKKTIRSPISMIVSNFEELRDQCANTPLAQFVEMSKYDLTQDWFSHNTPIFSKELDHLKNKPVKCLEIGSYEGRSAIWLLENILTHPESRLICVEPGYTTDIQILKQNLIAGGFYPQKVKIIKEESSWLRTLDESLDFVYVDGAHSARQTLEDGINAFRLCKPGGIIAFDDYLWEEWYKYTDDKSSPKTGIDAFLDCYASYITILHKGYQVWIKKN